MLDIQFISDNAQKLKQATENKGLNPDIIDKVLDVDQVRKKLILQVESLRAQKNKLTKEDRDKGRQIKEKLKDIEPQLRKIEANFKALMLQVSNLPDKDVPIGKDESENEFVKKWGKKTKFDFKPKDHIQLGESLDLIDIKKAVKVSGSRFGYLKNDAVLLEFALINFALDTLIKEGFIPVVPPVLIKTEMMRNMGYMEHEGDKQMYQLENQVLVGTSEQSIGPMHADEVLKAKNLPLRYISFSTCFRKEAGTYGKDTKGIFRVHQFDKMEMFSFTKAENSEKEHQFLLSLEEKLLQALKIPYQVVKMCTGDLGAPATKKYDLEAWIPSQNKYRELTSTSNTTDFQSRRLNIKYKEGDNKSKYVHMLNGTAFAIGRTLIAILENYQQKDGSVKIPQVLQPYINQKIIKSHDKKA